MCKVSGLPCRNVTQNESVPHEAKYSMRTRIARVCMRQKQAIKVTVFLAYAKESKQECHNYREKDIVI